MASPARTGRVLACAAAGVLLAAVTAFGQGTPARGGKWEVEVHAGGNFGSSADSGTSTSLPRGEPFTTFVGGPSRRTSSWYFGDGTALFNELSTAFRIAPRITPLDPILSKSIARRRPGVAAGARVTRALSRRFSAELSVDYSAAKAELTDDALNAVESTRTTFISGWNGILATGPFFSPRVTSDATIVARGGHQVVATGALNVALLPGRRFEPYVTAGAGVLRSGGKDLSVKLDGNYQFMLGGLFPMNERDVVTVRISRPDQSFAGVVGGGVKYMLTRRMGVRVEVRDLIAANEHETIVSANPVVATGTPGSFIASFTMPSLQFSSTTAVRSTLGAQTNDFIAFKSTGQQHMVTAVIGMYWRF